jgi:hypothetical protein
MIENKKRLVVKRIALSKVAQEFVDSEIKRIKGKGAHFKLNESMLASAMIELFCSKHLKKESEEIEAKFFNRKVYLKNLIEKSTSEDDLSKSLDEFLHKPSLKKQKHLETRGQKDD